MHNKMRFESATFSCKLSFLEDRRRAQGAGREQVCGPGPGRRAAAGRGERRAGGAGGKHRPSRCPPHPVNWRRLSVQGLRQQQAAKEVAGEDPGSRPHGGRTRGPQSRWAGLAAELWALRHSAAHKARRVTLQRRLGGFNHFCSRTRVFEQRGGKGEGDGTPPFFRPLPLLAPAPALPMKPVLTSQPLG